MTSYQTLSGIVLRIATFAALGIAGLNQAQATPLTLGQASNYNVFVLGNFTESNTDSEGRIAVGGNFTPANGGGFTIASSMGSDPAGVYDLVVGGNYTNNGYMLGGGDAWVGGNMNWNSLTLPHNAYVNGTATNNGGGSVGGTIYAGACAEPGYLSCKVSAPTAAPINFLSAQTNLDTISSTLASTAANGTVNFDGHSTYTLTGSSSTMNVFDLTASSYNGATINITAPAGSTVIVNVPGTADSINGGSINLNGVTAANVIFNYSSATTISISSLAFNGTLLAPYASFNGSASQLNGQLIADNAAGSTEFHNVLFSGTLPSGSGGTVINADSSQGSATPEPATWAMMLGAGLMVYAIRRRSLTIG